MMVKEYRVQDLIAKRDACKVSGVRGKDTKVQGVKYTPRITQVQGLEATHASHLANKSTPLLTLIPCPAPPLKPPATNRQW